MQKLEWINIEQVTRCKVSMDKRKVERYSANGYLTVRDGQVNTKEIKYIANFEKEIRTKYVRLSTLFNKYINATCQYFASFYEAYLYIFKFINFSNDMFLINHDGKQYIKKSAVEKIKSLILDKNTVVKQLGLNDIIFDTIISDNNFKVLTFSKTSKFITLESFYRIKQLVENGQIYVKYDWQKLYRIVKEGNFNIISFYKEGFKLISEKYGIKVKNYENKGYIDLKALKELKAFLDCMPDSYINIEDASKFSKSKSTYRTLNNKEQLELKSKLSIFKIKFIELNNNHLYPHLFICKNDYSEFLERYITYKEIVRRFRRYRLIIDKAIKDQEILSTKIFGQVFYNLCDIEKINIKKDSYENAKRSYILSKFREKNTHSYNKQIMKSDCKRMLNIDSQQINILLRDGDITYSEFNGRVLFNKKMIRKLQERNNFLINNFIPVSFVEKEGMMKNAYNHPEVYKTFGAEKFAFKKSYTRLIPITVANEENVILQRKKLISQIDYSDPYSAFTEYIKINSISIPFQLNETFNEWLKFVNKKLNRTQVSSINIELEVVKYFNATKILLSLCGNENIFLKTTNEINLGLMPYYKNRSQKHCIVLFLKEIHQQRKTKNIETAYRPKQFKFYNKSNYQKSDKDIEEVYIDEVFLDLFKFCKETFHKKQALYDSLFYLQGGAAKSNDYAYSWFYLVLHLNNAWRHIDFINMKMIDISFLNVSSLEEFSKYELSKAETNKIITLLTTRKYTVSKTGERNKLYVSDELKESVATAYVICHFLNERKHPLSNNIIHFSNKYNRFLKKQHSIFNQFRREIKFSNRKMNKTLMTTMVKLISKYENSVQGVQIAKSLRSHRNVESTSHYINYSNQDVNEVTKALFDNGIFGFIPNLLENIADQNSSNDRQSLTSSETFKTPIENIYNIEVSAGFLNKLHNEKVSLIDYLNSKGLEYIYELMNKLSLNIMKSKDENFQCLRAELGCNKPELDCKNCLLSIPNRFSVSVIVKSIEDSVLEITSNFEKYTRFEKTRIANGIFSELELLNYAMKKFGESNVLDMFDNKKQSYLSILDLLDEVNNEHNLIDYISKSHLLEGN